jgi:predicted Na+-dependent transporter
VSEDYTSENGRLTGRPPTLGPMMMANQLLNHLFNAGIVVSIGATVLALGMSYRVAELLAPLRRVWIVVLMIVVNAIAVPAAAWGIANALPIEEAADACGDRRRNREA